MARMGAPLARRLENALNFENSILDEDAMADVLSMLRDFILALTFGWLGLSFDVPDDRVETMRAERHAVSAACPSTVAGPPGHGVSYRSDCQE